MSCTKHCSFVAKSSRNSACRVSYIVKLKYLSLVTGGQGFDVISFLYLFFKLRCSDETFPGPVLCVAMCKAVMVTVRLLLVGCSPALKRCSILAALDKSNAMINDKNLCIYKYSVSLESMLEKL